MLGAVSIQFRTPKACRIAALCRSWYWAIILPTLWGSGRANDIDCGPLGFWGGLGCNLKQSRRFSWTWVVTLRPHTRLYS